MNISMMLELPASIAPDQPILADEARDFTYGELLGRVAKAAGMMIEMGVTPEDRIGIFAMSSTRVVEVLLATSAIRAVCVPMNYRARANEMAHLLTDSGIRFIFTDERYAADLRAAGGSDLRVIVLDGEYDGLVEAAEPVDEFESEGDEAILMYTSGTTSLPKGAVLGHAGLTSFILAAGEVADGTDRGTAAIAVPLYHIAGLTTLLVSLFTGRRIVLLREFTPEAWLDLIERHRVTDAFLVPTMLKRVLDAGVGGRNLESLDILRYGAAPMPENVILEALEALPDTTRFMGAYGLTETTSTVAVLDSDDHDLKGPDGDRRRKRLRSVGRLLEDVELEIRDEDGVALPPGEVGKVVLLTARAMRGYSGESGNDGWVETGDLGYLDEDGYLFLVGRAGDMIIRGGENVAPLEVESVLLSHEAVSQAAVVGVPDDEWGQRVVAAVVLSDSADATDAELIEHCRPLLAGFKRPERLEIVESLPYTSTGKLMRRKVLELVVSEARAGST